MRTEAGKPIGGRARRARHEVRSSRHYIDWRRPSNLSDDIMTELLNVEFTDQDGVTLGG